MSVSRSELSLAGERTQRLIKGIEDLFKMMDEGILVRDISRDGEADFYKRNLDFVMRMAKIKQAVDEAKLVAMPVCGACGRNYRPDEFSKGEYCQTCQPGNIRASLEHPPLTQAEKAHNSGAASIAASYWPAPKAAKAPVKSAALELIETINATGGISRALEPVGAPEWIDLALVYVKACEECGVEPKYNSHLNECDKCHTPVEEIIGCPDGDELCQSCFDASYGVGRTL